MILVLRYWIGTIPIFNRELSPAVGGYYDGSSLGWQRFNDFFVIIGLCGLIDLGANLKEDIGEEDEGEKSDHIEFSAWTSKKYRTQSDYLPRKPFH